VTQFYGVGHGTFRRNLPVRAGARQLRETFSMVDIRFVHFGTIAPPLPAGHPRSPPGHQAPSGPNAASSTGHPFQHRQHEPHCNGRQMRRGGILSLTCEHVQLEKRYAHLPDKKNGDSRNVLLLPMALKLLRGLPSNISFDHAVHTVFCTMKR
jgi:hypothetical protein